MPRIIKDWQRPSVLHNLRGVDVRIDGFHDDESRHVVHVLLINENIAPFLRQAAITENNETVIIAYGWSESFAQELAIKLTACGAYVSLIYKVWEEH